MYERLIFIHNWKKKYFRLTLYLLVCIVSQRSAGGVNLFSYKCRAGGIFERLQFDDFLKKKLKKKKRKTLRFSLQIGPES